MGNLFLTKKARRYNRAKRTSSISGAGKIGQLHVKELGWNIPNTIHKDQLKMDWKPKCNIRNCKTLRGKHKQKTFYDINQSKILCDPPPRVMKIKTKVNKWDLIKLRNFCTAKETISKMKRQHSEWEKIIANEVTDKGSISKTFKQLIQLNTNKKTQSESGKKT